jgi:hypothetical protein
MSMRLFGQMQSAIRHLNPAKVREEAARPLPMDFGDEPLAVREILELYPNHSLALARALPAFRRPVIEGIIGEVSRENALFALLTALPAAIPNIFALGWAAGEFASDTAVLTVNQIRMAFLIAAASGEEVGFGEQKRQIGVIISAAFGWRALARELAGRIPFGEGLIPKAAIAYAGTYVAGLGLQRYYEIGGPLTAAQREAAYDMALESGRQIARWALRRSQT